MKQRNHSTVPLGPGDELEMKTLHNVRLPGFSLLRLAAAVAADAVNISPKTSNPTFPPQMHQMLIHRAVPSTRGRKRHQSTIQQRTSCRAQK